MKARTGWDRRQRDQLMQTRIGEEAVEMNDSRTVMTMGCRGARNYHSFWSEFQSM